MTRKRGVSFWPMALAGFMLVAALATLLLLRNRIVQGQTTMINDTVRQFEATEVLGRRESNSLVFSSLETLASASENGIIRRIYATKILGDGREVTVLPFESDLVEPNWRDLADWRRFAIGPEPVGYIYIDMENSIVRAINVAIGLLATILAGGLGILIQRTRGKEAQVGILQGELEERKAQVIRLERLALAGQLSANVFHDIKKPVLNIKHEITDALEAEEEPSLDIYREIRDQTELFLQMLRDLGMEGFVNAGSEEKEWCDLEEIVDRSLRLVKYEQGAIETSFDFTGGDQFLIEGEQYRLIQLFSNLFLNAFQAMGDTGTLKVTGNREGKTIRVLVEDSGPGIPPEKREQVFNPFVTGRADKGGSGLGLYISKTIIKDLGGRVDIDKSEDLGGARFLIEFPVRE